MELVVACCCGLDVHQAQLTACVRTIVQGMAVELIETFGTTTPDLLALRDWLLELGVTHVAMESTGVYWKAPYYVLEDSFEMLLVNAAHIKHVPGRKTDTIDAQWIAQLLAHGLLKSSFVPPKPIRRLRDLTRYRKALIGERTRMVNRLHKVLEDAGVKLAIVATDVMGVSGRAMMRALIEGQADPDALAQLAKGKLRVKLPALRKALQGRFEEHHAFLLERMLAHIEELEADIQAVSDRIEEEIRPFERALELLDTIPGVDRRAAEVIVAETGAEMSRFPTPAHLGFVGRGVPRAERICWQAQIWQDPQRLKVAADDADRIRPRRQPHKRHSPAAALPATRPSPRRQESDHRDRPRDPHEQLAAAHNPPALPRPRTKAAPRTRDRTRPPPRDPPTRSPRPQSHARTANRGRLTHGHFLSRRALKKSGSVRRV